MTADYEAPEPTGISIFVNAATAPYLYSWEGVGGEHTGTWPGTQMSEQTTTDDGKTWWKHTFEADVTQVNIILNNGNGSQTSDIQDITSDRYFTYDGASTFEDVTSQYLDVPEFELPDCAVYLEDKLFIYFEAPSTYPTPYVWAWNDNGNLNGTEWPGTGVMENVGTASNGNEVYRFIFEEEPTGLLFSNAGSPQTSDFNFVNGGYYTISGQQAIVKPTTGVKAVELATDDNSQAPAYNLAGQRVGKDYRGLVIVNGRKQFRP